MIEIKLYTSFFELLFCRAFVIFNLKDQQKKKEKKSPQNDPCILCFSLFYSYIYIPLSVKVIGGELQERLIPVPYSKNTTDQAVSSSCFHFPFLPEKKMRTKEKTERKMHQLVAFSLVYFFYFFTYLDLSI